MGLIESKFQLERQITEAQALVGRIRNSQSMMHYYGGTEEPPSDSELETSLGYLHLAIDGLKKQVTLLEQSKAYKKEYNERYAVYDPEEVPT